MLAQSENDHTTKECSASCKPWPSFKKKVKKKKTNNKNLLLKISHGTIIIELFFLKVKLKKEKGEVKSQTMG